MFKSFPYIMLLVACHATSVMADNPVRVPGKRLPQVQNEQEQQNRQLPPQAYKDCIGKREGDSVQITLPSKEKVSATCTAHGKGLYARPNHLPKLHKGGQPVK